MSEIKVLVDAKVVAEFPQVSRVYRKYVGWGTPEGIKTVGMTSRETEERYAEDLKEAVKEFNDFVRDHRSQDIIDLNVEMVYERRCEYCNSNWEDNLGDDAIPYCCQQATAEEIANRSLAKTAAGGEGGKS